MSVIRLPRVLENSLEVMELNSRLRGGGATLDWSDVRVAPGPALATLLSGLDLVEHGDLLGLETAPDALADKIAAATSCAPQRRAGPVAREEDQHAPAVWRSVPLSPADDGDDPVDGAGDALSGGDVTAVPPGASQPAIQDIPLHQAEPAVGSPGDGVAEPADGEAIDGPILRVPSPRALRDELEQVVLRDLLGPAGGPQEEIDEDSVRERYLVGLLAPRGQSLVPEESDELAVAGSGTSEDGQPDTNALQSRSMFPSSVGLTFSVAAEADALVVTCRWGQYERVTSETLLSEKTGAPKLVWKRRQAQAVSAPLPLREGKIGDWVPDAEQPDVYLSGRVRRLHGDWIVSLFLVNNQVEPRQRGDRAWLFQPELEVAATDRAAVFRRRPLVVTGKGDPAPRAEEQALAMTYRRRVEFAVGHGIAVHVETAPHRPDHAIRIATCVAPCYEVAKTTPPASEDFEALAGLVCDMKRLADMPVAQLSAALAALPDAYEGWIERQRQRLAGADPDLAAWQETATEALARCERSLARIRAGLALLSRDPRAADAFRFMNRAMWLQRTHSLYAEEKRRGGSPEMSAIDVPENRTWYPFQLAFILVNLPALTDLHHDDRAESAAATADLLWFPTGGGKTEAYLGLTAYTLAIRRLHGVVAGHDGEHGVAVLMRYTLRLLTLQQFQRAAALICGCEAIRRAALDAGDGRWGATPFRIGLWVGQRTTPNSTAQADESVKQSRGAAPRFGGMGGSGSPAQLTNCPWCGAAIDAGKHIKVESLTGGRGRTFMYCGDPLGQCLFSERKAPGEGLPVLVVDEEIYRLLPALLIATVDKFAQMPWKGETAMLFGRVSAYCPRHGFRSPDLADSDSHPARNGLPRVATEPHLPLRPPDLIIQDELHLISGPLGTLVGLYETAIDELASWTVDGRRVRPKVIASTATIRQAGEQVRSLFLRRVEVFPPQGLDAEDNFFAVQRPVDDQYPGRRYLGICAPGRRLKAVLIRVYVAYLAAAQQLYEKYGAAADPWMTLVGYFNSMRELGGMRRLVDDDVRTRLQRMDERGMAKRRPPVLEELTSRKSSTDIPALLDRLERRFDPATDSRKKRAATAGQKGSGGSGPLDVLLATNMVSVGVDVKRLGLMVVSGQPKSTAEYIQATSRVGRSSPGLVCTVFNWARPRDLSHYERFEHYHATYYQHVEALSVTPFAPRALDRGLAALLVALVRLAGIELNGNKGAGRITRDHPFVRAALAAITRRAGEIDTGIRDGVTAALDARLDEWLAEASGGSGPQSLGYRDENDGLTRGLLRKAEQGAWHHFTVLNSLRDVEPSIGLILDDGVVGEERAWSFTPRADSTAEDAAL